MIKNVKAILALLFTCLFLTSPIFSAKKKSNRKNHKISKNLVKKSKREKELENSFLNNAVKSNAIENNKIENIKKLLNYTKNIDHKEFKKCLSFLLKCIKAQDKFIEDIQSYAQISGNAAEYYIKTKDSNDTISTITDIRIEELPHKLIVTCLKYGELKTSNDVALWTISDNIKELTQQEIDNIVSGVDEKFKELMETLKKCYIMAKMDEQVKNQGKLLTKSYIQMINLLNSPEAHSYPEVINKCSHSSVLINLFKNYIERETKSQPSNISNDNKPRYFYNANDIKLQNHVDKIYKSYQSKKIEFDELKNSTLRILKLKQEQPISDSSELESPSSEPISDSSELESPSSPNSLRKLDNSINNNIENNINYSVIESYHERVESWFNNSEQALEEQGYKDRSNKKKYAPSHTYGQIIKHHKFSAIVDNYIETLGISKEDYKNNRKTISYNIPGEIIYNDNKRQVGVFSYGINEDKICYHRSFSKSITYKDMENAINQRTFDAQFPSLESSTAGLKTILKAEKNTLRLLEKKKSSVIKEDNYTITIADPENNMTILLYKVTN